MQKELLSAYMDGEEVSAELTEQLCQDKDSQESWAVYHTVRSVMRKESPVLLGADFTAKMADLIELEEVKHVEIKMCIRDRYVAALKGLSMEEFAQISTQNFERLFKINVQ